MRSPMRTARTDAADTVPGKLDLSGVISWRVSLDEAPATDQALDRGEIPGRAMVLTGG